MRGKFKGKIGNVLEVNLKESKVIIEGIQAKKQDGSKVNIKLQPSNLQIIELSERLKKMSTESKQEVSIRPQKTSDETKSAEIKNQKKTKNEKTESIAEVKKIK